MVRLRRWSISRLRAIVNSQVSNRAWPLYCAPRTSTRIQTSWKRSSASLAVSRQIEQVAQKPVLVADDQLVGARILALEPLGDGQALLAHLLLRPRLRRSLRKIGFTEAVVILLNQHEILRARTTPIALHGEMSLICRLTCSSGRLQGLGDGLCGPPAGLGVLIVEDTEQMVAALRGRERVPCPRAPWAGAETPRATPAAASSSPSMASSRRSAI